MGRERRTDWQEPFLADYALHGIQALSCRKARVDPGTVKTERGRDPEFAAKYDDAFASSNADLELTMFSWARGGLVLKKTRTTTRVLKDGSTETTTTTEESVERSPAVSIFMLKSRVPDVYGDRIAIDGDLTVETVTREEANTAVGSFDAAVVRLADRRRPAEGDQRSGTG